jgi:hypothetical protein
MASLKVLFITVLAVIISVLVGFASHHNLAGTWTISLTCGPDAVWVQLVVITHPEHRTPVGGQAATQNFPFSAAATAPPNTPNNGRLLCAPFGADSEDITITIAPHEREPNQWAGFRVHYICPLTAAGVNVMDKGVVVPGVAYGLTCPSTGITHGTFQGPPAIAITSKSVPSTTQWGLLALSLLLAGSLAFMIRRRFSLRPARA